MKTVMVFGTFDGPHTGHAAMLKEAGQHGDFLIAVVAQDHIVRHLKGRLPKLNLMERMEQLKKLDGVDKVIISDKDLGTWEIIKRERPDVVAIGYDQHALRENLESHLDKLEYRPEIVQLTTFEPNEKPIEK